MGFVLSHSPNRAMPEKKSTKRALPLSVALFCMERDKMSEYEIFKKAIDDLLLKNFVIEIEDGQIYTVLDPKLSFPTSKQRD